MCLYIDIYTHVYNDTYTSTHMGYTCNNDPAFSQERWAYGEKCLCNLSSFALPHAAPDLVCQVVFIEGTNYLRDIGQGDAIPLI